MAAVLVLAALPVAQAAPASAEQLPTGALTGLASYYGWETCAGRRLCLTASGERFAPEGLTCAHRWLPFGTRLRVERADTGAVVYVRVNDRGPWVAGRVLDLSQGAMRALGGLRAGVVPVQAVIVDGPPGMVAAEERGGENDG
jgi:rare lipoprotein A